MQGEFLIPIPISTLWNQEKKISDYISDVLQNIFPLTWVDEGADIDSDPDLLKEAKGFLVTPFVAVDAVMGVLIALGCVMIMGAIVNYVRIGRSSNNC